MGMIVLFEEVNRMCKKVIQDIRDKYSAVDDMPKAAEVLLQKTIENEFCPVSVVDIAQKIGFKIFESDMKSHPNVSGLVAIDLQWKDKLGSDKIIAVNKDDNYGHKRFAIAHEIAHYIFDFDEKTHITYYNLYTTDDITHRNENDVRELRANKFAACLLMPEAEFRTKLTECKDENSLFETTKRLADIFKVSAEAIRRRMIELNIIPGGVNNGTS